MKRSMIWLSVSLLVLLAGGFTMLADNPAVVINDSSSCGMLDGDGGFVYTDNTHAVTTSSGNGSMNCQANVAAPSGGKAKHWDFSNTSLPCVTPAGSTTDWKETVSADGQASLSCHFSQ